MYQKKLMKKQIEASGLRLGDSCSIFPFHGKRKAFTLNRYCIDLISKEYRPADLSMSYIELPRSDAHPFHYRLELDQKVETGRFVLKTMKGEAFWLNGHAAKEAYIERMDRIMIDDNKVNFDPFDLKEILDRQFEHPILMQQNLISSGLNILIEGETGTGKTHLAKKIHEKSGRAGAFVALNLSSFNPQLIESELFGHRKGSFTGAVSERLGAFKNAEHGTLFLDEIDSLPLELQTKILTFLDSKRFRRVGDTREHSIETRLIFASGRPLEKLVQLGSFRRDFYFRLKSGHTVELESLRNNVKRIDEACQHFSLKNGIVISRRLMEFYETLPWPGNLRQLFGHLEKKKVLSKSTKLDFDSFDEDLLLQSSDLKSFSDTLDLVPMKEYKEEYVKKVFAICEGNISLAAKYLEVSPKTVKGIIERPS
jgi:DNA-binding NtrC family response regulator